jgi:hypothetical protein
MTCCMARTEQIYAKSYRRQWSHHKTTDKQLVKRGSKPSKQSVENYEVNKSFVGQQKDKTKVSNQDEKKNKKKTAQVLKI